MEGRGDEMDTNWIEESEVVMEINGSKSHIKGDHYRVAARLMGCRLEDKLLLRVNTLPCKTWC